MNDRRISHDEIVASLVNLHQLTFEVTDACNLQCKYCGYGDMSGCLSVYAVTGKAIAIGRLFVMTGGRAEEKRYAPICSRTCPPGAKSLPARRQNRVSSS